MRRGAGPSWVRSPDMRKLPRRMALSGAFSFVSGRRGARTVYAYAARSAAVARLARPQGAPLTSSRAEFCSPGHDPRGYCPPRGHCTWLILSCLCWADCEGGAYRCRGGASVAHDTVRDTKWRLPVVLDAAGGVCRRTPDAWRQPESTVTILLVVGCVASVRVWSSAVGGHGWFPASIPSLRTLLDAADGWRSLASSPDPGGASANRRDRGSVDVGEAADFDDGPGPCRAGAAIRRLGSLVSKRPKAWLSLHSAVRSQHVAGVPTRLFV